MSSQKRYNRAYKNAKNVSFDDTSKIVLFSDCHRGDNSFADDFAKNRNIYYHALKHYYTEGFTYCELGDGDELWENLSFDSILQAHKNVYQLLRLFYLEDRLHLIWGNHDMAYKNQDFVKDHLYYHFDRKTGKDESLFPDIKIEEAIILRHSETQQELFLAHGHQADTWNYTFWTWSRFLVRILWKPLNVMGIADPTSPAKNYKELIEVEKRTKRWTINNDNIITVIGHTHRPRFPEPGDIAFFNTGSCVHPRSITGLEIEHGKISLIKWQISTSDEGVLKIVRVLLEGPQRLIDYKTDD